MILALSVRHKWNIERLDVITAFLNLRLDDDRTYITLPTRLLELFPQIPKS
jgi:hypothetical protein